jgi:phytoene dehydrogenase-like protein
MKKKILIIGGGVSGLSAGIFAQMNGFDSEILEMHTITGGQCTAWKRKGYTFDYCLHWLVGSSFGAYYDIYRKTDVITPETKIIYSDIYLGLKDESGNDFVIYTDIDKWEKFLIDYAPEDARAIRKMCGNMRSASLLDSFDNAPGSRSIFEYISKVFTMLPALMVVSKYRKLSCTQYIDSLGLKNEKLKQNLGRIFGDGNFSSLALIMMIGWFHRKNAGYLIGGSLAIAERMTKKFLSLGGTLTTGKKAVKLNVNDGKVSSVILDDGSEKSADIVINTADLYSVMNTLLEGKYTPPEMQTAFDSWELFKPIVQVSIGVNKKIESKYNVMQIPASGRFIGSTQIKNTIGFMNYSFDPTMAPDGKTTLVVRFETPWNLWKDISDEKYTAEKEKIKQNVISILESEFPGITESIEETDVATPLTDIRYTGVRNGSYEGFLITPGTLTASLPNKIPALKNFYLAGQWLTPGGGLPPSIQSGKWVVQTICKDFKMKFNK